MMRNALAPGLVLVKRSVAFTLLETFEHFMACTFYRAHPFGRQLFLGFGKLDVAIGNALVVDYGGLIECDAGELAALGRILAIPLRSGQWVV
jgi:hypothetical protein